MSPATETAWQSFRAGTSLGKIGSEGGVILRDEEHAEGARITLERSEEKRMFRQPTVRFAITCGIYDWMVHTRFFAAEQEAVHAYESMKPALACILKEIPAEHSPGLQSERDHIIQAIDDFIEQYP